MRYDDSNYGNTNADTLNTKIHTASYGTKGTDKDTDTWVEVVKLRGKKKNKWSVPKYPNTHLLTVGAPRINA